MRDFPPCFANFQTSPKWVLRKIMSLFTPISNERYYTIVVNQIKGLIDSGKLKDGEMLPSEMELANEMNTSRNTVREALLILDFMGYVATKQGKGTFVTAPAARPESKPNLAAVFDDMVKQDSGLLKEFLDLHALLSGSAAELAAITATEDDLREIRENLAREKAPSAQNEYAQPFHQSVARATKNSILEELISSVAIITNRVSFQSVDSSGGQYSDQSFSEHQQIFKAIEERDPDRARELMRGHISAVQHRIFEEK